MKLDIIKAILLGALQGVTEFIPVSSSGHLLVMRNLLGVGDVSRLFDVLMHIPTLLVILIVFRKIIKRLFSSLVTASLDLLKKRTMDIATKGDMRLIGIVIIASIPIVIFGIFFERFDAFFEQSPRFVGILFIFTGILLLCTKIFQGRITSGNIGIRSGIIIGIAQGFGVLPGISRSGITIATSLLCGIKQEDAGEFSFIIAVPAITGAFFYKLKDSVAMNINPVDLTVGLIVCFIVGLGSLLLLIRLVKQGHFYLFSIYLIPAGIATLMFV